MRHFYGCALIALFSAVSVSAQERSTRKVEASSGAKEIQKLSVVMKSKILIREDQPAGRIVDVVLSDGGCIEYLVAEHESKYYVLPYQAAEVRYVDQVVFVDVAPAQFRQVQFFSQDRWPDVYSTEFRQQVNTVFNVRVDAGTGGRTRSRDNDRAPGAGDRNDRDTAKPAPGADRPPRGEGRPKAGDRDGNSSPKPGAKGNDGDPSPAPKPEAKGNEREPAARTPKGEAPSTAPKPSQPTPPKEKDADRDEKETEKDEKLDSPPKPAPKP